MLFSGGKTRSNAFLGEGAPIVLRATRRAGKNIRSRAFALMFLCCALTFGSIFATVAQVAPTSSELLEQGHCAATGAGKLAEAECEFRSRWRNLAPSDSVILILDAKVKGRLGESSSAVALLQRAIRLNPESAQAHVDLAIALADLLRATSRQCLGRNGNRNHYRSRSGDRALESGAHS